MNKFIAIVALFIFTIGCKGVPSTVYKDKKGRMYVLEDSCVKYHPEFSGRVEHIVCDSSVLLKTYLK